MHATSPSPPPNPTGTHTHSWTLIRLGQNCLGQSWAIDQAKVKMSFGQGTLPNMVMAIKYQVTGCHENSGNWYYIARPAGSKFN